MKKLEVRSDLGEIRSTGTGDDGIVTAYLTKWDSVDSWNTKFERGSFKKTFEKRGASGMRLIWNHTALAGKVIELREDEVGPLATVKFNLETRAGQDAYSHVKAEDVDCFSFGFNTIKDRWDGSVRSIQEVDMRECGPVIFQANDDAKITEVRAEDFDQTFKEAELRQRGYKLLRALNNTTDDVFWGSYDKKTTPEEVIALVDTAISKFHTAYIGWLNEYYDSFEKRSDALPPRETRSDIRGIMADIDGNKLIENTPLTKQDVDSLRSGKLLPLEARWKVKELPEVLQEAHKKEHRTMIENTCSELRSGGLDGAELERISALIGISESKETTGTKGFFAELRGRLLP